MRHAKAIASGAALLGGALCIGWLLFVDAPVLPSPAPPMVAPAINVASAPIPAASAAIVAPTSATLTPPRVPWRDTLAGATDLRAVYQRNITSSDPTQRAAAWRAWSACMPAFLGSATQAATPETLAAAMPQGADSGLRIEALRSLYARCQGFISRRYDEQLSEASKVMALHAHGDARSGAEAAHELLAMGEREAALQRVADAVAALDPYEIRELSGLVGRFRRDAEQRDPGPDDAVRDAALAVVACDLGLDCGPGSLLATQLCAMQGQCTGDVVDRVLANFGAIDRGQVDTERARLAVQLRERRFDARRYFDQR